MAKLETNALINAFSGRLGNMILKKYSYGVVASSRPDRSNVKLSKKQKNANRNFKLAVAYAKSIINDPKKREVYKKMLKPGKSVYHTALAEYLNKEKTEG